MNNFQKQILLIIILGVLVRLIIMPFYAHPDIKTFNFQASFLSQGVWNIYSYLSENKASLPLKEEFVYFPLTYFFMGGYQIAISPLLGDSFDNWLSNASSESFENAGTFRFLLLLKLPYLVFDVFTGILLMAFFTSESQKKKVLILWLFNPLSLILIYVYSNFDIIPTSLTVLSLLLLQRKRFFLSALCLGVGAGFKAYPLIFLPVLLLYAKGWQQKLGVLGASLGLSLLISGPFYMTEAFRASTLVSGLTTRILQPVVGIGFGEGIIISLIPLFVLFLTAFFKKDLSWEHNVFYYFSIPILILAFIHYHVQWLLWVVPFALLLVVKIEKINLSKNAFLVVLVSAFATAFTIPLLYNDASMSVALLRPISSWFTLLPTPFKVVSKVYDVYTLQSILHSFLAGATLVITWQLFKERKA